MKKMLFVFVVFIPFLTSIYFYWQKTHAQPRVRIDGFLITFLFEETRMAGMFLEKPEGCFLDEGDDLEPPFKAFVCDLDGVEHYVLETDKKANIKRIKQTFSKAPIAVKSAPSEWLIFMHPPFVCFDENKKPLECPDLDPPPQGNVFLDPRSEDGNECLPETANPKSKNQIDI